MATPPDVDPIRAGADPVLSLIGAGLTCRPDLQPTGLRMTSVLVSWLRYHFGAASRIEFPVLAGRVWVSDPELSPIKITSLAEWTPLTTDQRPALLVDRLDQNLDTGRAGIGERMMNGRPGQFAHFMQGSHVVHCLGGREGEADYLAYEAYREFSRYADVAREELGLLRFRAPQIGKRAQIQDTDGKPHYTTPVLVAYAYEESWISTPRDLPEIVSIVFGSGA